LQHTTKSTGHDKKKEGIKSKKNESKRGENNFL
jgi:hypothetical protein